MGTKMQQAASGRSPEMPAKDRLTLLKVSDVAKRLSLSASKVYELVENRRISHHRIGGAIRISQEQLEQFLDETLQERGPKDRQIRRHAVPRLRHLKI